ncbi:hypothetical protein KVV02_002820 [Mortierella alpina]|uniref:Uncharacterized protein n=1 Tax=Mortierella alpina TaxID=64518 RepID=A0A9P7ZXR1_MORAP|nr:hypothetical protein KVV02_002820 [Mortierella alpina]
MNATHHATSTRVDAINACRLMDTLVSTPQWRQSLFADSIQLFPDNLLMQAKHSQAKDLEQTPLDQILSDLQGLVNNAQKKLGHFLTEDPGLTTTTTLSSSLRLDASGLSALNKATKQLVETMDAFQHVFDQDISSHLQTYPHRTEPKDTIPGLEARSLNKTQQSLREMLDNIRNIRGAMESLTDPQTSQTQRTLLDAKRGLVRGSDDSDVRAMLERLAAMAATLERTLRRINA